MTDAARLFDELSGIGATIRLVDRRIILRAGLCPIPASLVCRVRQAKQELFEFVTANTPCNETPLSLEPSTYRHLYAYYPRYRRYRSPTSIENNIHTPPNH